MKYIFDRLKGGKRIIEVQATYITVVGIKTRIILITDLVTETIITIGEPFPARIDLATSISLQNTIFLLDDTTARIYPEPYKTFPDDKSITVWVRNFDSDDLPGLTYKQSGDIGNAEPNNIRQSGPH